jgi:hypothetical protein
MPVRHWSGNDARWQRWTIGHCLKLSDWPQTIGIPCRWCCPEVPAEVAWGATIETTQINIRSLSRQSGERFHDKALFEYTSPTFLIPGQSLNLPESRPRSASPIPWIVSCMTFPLGRGRVHSSASTWDLNTRLVENLKPPNITRSSGSRLSMARAGMEWSYISKDRAICLPPSVRHMDMTQEVKSLGDLDCVL